MKRMAKFLNSLRASLFPKEGEKGVTAGVSDSWKEAARFIALMNLIRL
ncbi:hypothetical protein ACP70R_034223 [Stipagrostis hirtigluma subsp. patula]